MDGSARLDSQPDESLLLEAARLATIGTLTRTVAHEINNPLLAILGLIDFVLADAEKGTEPHAYLELIQQNGLEIKHVVGTLLEFTREPSNERVAVSLAEVAADTVVLARGISPVSFAALSESHSSSDTTVHANANQLKQLILHLIRHGERAILDGGSVVVTSARENDFVSVRVSDMGARPIPAEESRPEHAELDAGLAVAHAIARAHGGELRSSGRSDGTDFTLWLPA
ncbi:MAG: sensor histidine kinase, partial [Gaiellaceae bacterium]